jgi:hypothetical protein
MAMPVSRPQLHSLDLRPLNAAIVEPFHSSQTIHKWQPACAQRCQDHGKGKSSKEQSCLQGPAPLIGSNMENALDEIHWWITPLQVVVTIPGTKAGVSAEGKTYRKTHQSSSIYQPDVKQTFATV